MYQVYPLLFALLMLISIHLWRDGVCGCLILQLLGQGAIPASTRLPNPPGTLPAAEEPQLLIWCFQQQPLCPGVDPWSSPAGAELHPRVQAAPGSPSTALAPPDPSLGPPCPSRGRAEASTLNCHFSPISCSRPSSTGRLSSTGLISV